MKLSERVKKRAVQAEREPGSSKIIASILRRWSGEIAQLESRAVELEQLKKDCAPFQAQIDQHKTYKTPEEF